MIACHLKVIVQIMKIMFQCLKNQKLPRLSIILENKNINIKKAIETKMGPTLGTFSSYCMPITEKEEEKLVENHSMSHQNISSSNLNDSFVNSQPQKVDNSNRLPTYSEINFEMVPYENNEEESKSFSKEVEIILPQKQEIICNKDNKKFIIPHFTKKKTRYPKQMNFANSFQNTNMINIFTQERVYSDSEKSAQSNR